ncbi:MAG: helix-turn-helix domain-containing protein [Candidatus Levyibacteriota bacterium]
MKSGTVEASYPIYFRENDAKKLGLLIQNRRSVVLVGMRRVGISNFLRFFLNHPGVAAQYVKQPMPLFIPVDLNDLVEREIFPFWILTLKRIVDYVEQAIENEAIKKKISQLFLDSIQSQDLFLTIDGIRKSLVMLTNNGYSPTLFFIRFDRIIDAATPAFFDNFQGLIDATARKLSFVFTSMRPLETLSPEVFTKHALAVFADTIYVQPAEHKDVKIIYDVAIKKYNIILAPPLEKKLLELVDGYNQYLQFALITLHEQKGKLTLEKMQEILLSDERIALQSEELWESLSLDEKQALEKSMAKKKLSNDEKEKSDYLYKTGLINTQGMLFSPLFEQFLMEKVVSQKKENHVLELSKKEHSLLTFLSGNKNEVCEREEIIEHVWQEEESLGVSDWAIDRLVARLRSKLKNQNSKDEIVTVKTRGYKLIET